MQKNKIQANLLTTKSKFLKIPSVLDNRNLLDTWSSITSHPTTPFLLLLVGLALAEFITALSVPQIGLVLHGLLLLSIIIFAAFSDKKVNYRFYLVMTLAPLVRLLSLSMPLLQFEFVNWYMVIGVPLFIATFIALRLTGYKTTQVGLTFGGKWWLQGVVILLGFGLGLLEYLILRPDPLIDSLGWQQVVYPALILLIFTGFMEELIFRGLMQRASLQSLGRFGFLYTAAVFAVLHIGYKSILDVVFVFGVGFLFAHIVHRTNAIWGVTLSHAITNITLFLVFPFFFAVSTTISPVPTAPETLDQIAPPAEEIPTPTPVVKPTDINKLGPIFVPLKGETSPKLEATSTSLPPTPTNTLPPPTNTLPPPTNTPLPSNTISPTYPPPPTAIPTQIPTITPSILPTDPPKPTSTPTPRPTEMPVLSSTPTATIKPTDLPTPTLFATLPPTVTPIKPTNTPIPTNTLPPTNTPIPPTATPIPTNTLPPTNTPIPPTDTPLPTNTLPPTNTPISPTDTPLPTNTLPPTSTPIPPTDEPVD